MAYQYVPVPQTFMAEMRYLWNGENCENTLYFKLRAGATDTTVAGLADMLYNWQDQELRPLQVATCALVEVYLTDLTTQTSPTYSLTPPTPSGGQLPGPSHANSVCPVVTFKTAQRGRSSRGRNYFPGIGEEQVAASTISSTYLTALDAAYSLLLAPAFSPNWEWHVVSRYSAGQPRAVGVALPVQAVVITSPLVGSQRGRVGR